MRDTELERQRHRQREKQAPCREPDVGLHPGSPGSHSGLKAALNRWATWAALFFFLTYLFASFTEVSFIFFLKILFIYSLETQRERERERQPETQAEGEAGSMQGARRGTPSWISRICLLYTSDAADD